MSPLGRAHQEAKGYKGIAYFRDVTKIIILILLFSWRALLQKNAQVVDKWLLQKMQQPREVEILDNVIKMNLAVLGMVI